MTGAGAVLGALVGVDGDGAEAHPASSKTRAATSKDRWAELAAVNLRKYTWQSYSVAVRDAATGFTNELSAVWPCAYVELEQQVQHRNHDDKEYQRHDAANADVVADLVFAWPHDQRIDLVCWQDEGVRRCQCHR